MQRVGQRLPALHVLANQCEQFAEGKVDRNRHKARRRVGRNRVGRRGCFARAADDVEVAGVAPETKLHAVRRRRFVDGDIPVARVVTEREFLDRACLILFVHAQQQAAVGRLATVVGHLLPAQIPIGVKPMWIASSQVKPACAVGLRQLAEMFLTENLGRRR